VKRIKLRGECVGEEPTTRRDADHANFRERRLTSHRSAISRGRAKNSARKVDEIICFIAIARDVNFEILNGTEKLNTPVYLS